MVHKSRRAPRGLTLTEVVVSSFLVGVMLVGAMRGVGATIRARLSSSQTSTAHQLAQALLTEILAQHYSEPDDSPEFGRESSESGGKREHWDDVDDYNTWSSDPPEKKDGEKLEDLKGWEREVVVDYVEPDDPSSISLFDQGLKRITVTVQFKGETLAEISALRSSNFSVEQ